MYVGILGKNFRIFMHRIVPISMIILEITFFIWRVDMFGFDTEFLPLGVCAISMIVTSIALLIDSEKLIKFIFMRLELKNFIKNIFLNSRDGNW
jgi:uncharacterized membrane protein YwaF